MGLKDHFSDIGSLCRQYYDLKNKPYFAGLSFRERLEAADAIVDGFKRGNAYFFRRIPSDFPATTSPHGVVHLASNDYLGLTQHPAVIKAGVEALRTLGAGAGSVPMLAGTDPAHLALEKQLAACTGFQAALTFSSGYAVNEGVLSALLSEKDVAILDMAVHASIIDGCSHTNIIFFKHNDTASLLMAMKKAEGYANKLIVVDGVYSMDGDIAPLPDILAIARNNDAWLMLDESHALGVVGENGWGTHSHFSLETRCDFITCSMGKALGGVGGFVAGSSQLIRFLEITCRPFVYSTSLPQNVAVQLQEALHIMKTEPSIHRRLMENAAFFKTGLETLGFETTGSESAIIPIIIRDETKLLRFCQYLHDRGVFVNPVFYPVVPKKKSRIRASVTAQLTSEALSYSLDVMASAASSLGIIH